MTKCTSEFVDLEIDIDIDDIIEFIEEHADYSDLVQIRNLVSGFGDKVVVGTLYDEQKTELLSEAFNKYNLEELQEILGWKPGKGIK